MREILFRALADFPSNHFWVYGGYCSMWETRYCFSEDYDKHEVKRFHYIAQDNVTDWGLPDRLELVPVLEHTVCQYTGLKDVNGNMVFENDIVLLCGSNHLVCWDGENAKFALKTKDGRYIDAAEITGGKVVGNMIENPDLF